MIGQELSVLIIMIEFIFFIRKFTIYLSIMHIYCILCRQIKGFNSVIYAIKCQQVVIGASLSEPHTSESPPQILVLSTMHKKL